MNGKVTKEIRRKVKQEKQTVANQMIVEILQAPFKYRLKFALKVLRGVKGLSGR